MYKTFRTNNALITMEMVKMLSLCSLSFSIHATEKLFTTTINPLPDSVLINSSDFTVSEITHFNSDKEDSTIFSSFGDIDGDGKPEIVINGWNNECGGTNTVPETSPIYVIKDNGTSSEFLDAESLFSTNVSDGTALVKVADFTNDGKNDVLIVGHNECPFVATTNTLYVKTDTGFIANSILPKMAMHEGSVVDFNGDGYLDLVGSAYIYSDEDAGIDTSVYSQYHQAALNKAIAVLINDKSGNFTPYAVRFNDAVEKTKQENEDNPNMNWIEPGSAVAAADFDNDGEIELVVVDSDDSGDGNPRWGSVHILIDNLKYEEKHIYGDVIALPDSYHRQRSDVYGNLSSNHMKGRISHSIQVDTFDFDNDGDADILVNTFIWVDDVNESTGIVQLYRNDGNMKFTDVTEDALYNYYIGQQASHEMIFLDVNNDGFKDLIQAETAYGVSQPKTWGTANGGEGWEGELYVSAEGTWTNEIFINTGNGKFVSAFWNGFHELNLKREEIFTSYGVTYEPWGLVDERMFPYMSENGRLNFITKGAGDPDVKFLFDVRSSKLFYSGPKGTLSSDRGAPGFSEYYYLTENPSVVSEINESKYADGLAHYLAEGKTQGLMAFAAGAKVHGSGNDDTIVLREGNETAFGYGGNDTFESGLGTDLLDGGDGNDSVSYSQEIYNYTVTSNNGEYTVISATSDSTDTLKNIESIVFNSVAYNFATTDTDGDGMSNEYEDANGLNKNDASDANLDADNDGINNLTEFLKSSSPTKADTDNDGLWDKYDSAPQVASSVAQTVVNDFNADGLGDIIYRNVDDLTWQIEMHDSFSSRLSSNPSGMSSCCGWLFNGAGDFNADGTTDVIIRNTQSGQWYIYNMFEGTLLSRGYAPIESAIYIGVQAVADFNNDGYADVLLRNEQTGEWTMSLMKNRSILQEYLPPMSKVLTWDIVDAKDFDGNGSADILIRNSSSGAWYIYLYEGTEIISRGYISALTNDLDDKVEGVGDIDGDGNFDVITRNTTSLEWTVHYMNGRTPKSSESISLSTSSAWEFNDINDYDGDGKSDVSVINRTSNQVYIYLMNGSEVKSKGYADNSINSDMKAQNLIQLY